MADNLKKLPKDKPLRKKASDYPVLSEEDFQDIYADLAGKQKPVRKQLEKFPLKGDHDR